MIHFFSIPDFNFVFHIFSRLIWKINHLPDARFTWKIALEKEDLYHTFYLSWRYNAVALPLKEKDNFGNFQSRWRHLHLLKIYNIYIEKAASALAGFHAGPFSGSNWNLGCWFLWREENQRTWRKTLVLRPELTTNSTHTRHVLGWNRIPLPRHSYSLEHVLSC